MYTTMRALHPNFVKSSFPFLSIDKEVLRLLLAKRRRETMDYPRIPIQGIKFKIPIVG